MSEFNIKVIHAGLVEVSHAGLSVRVGRREEPNEFGEQAWMFVDFPGDMEEDVFTREHAIWEAQALLRERALVISDEHKPRDGTLNEDLPEPMRFLNRYRHCGKSWERVWSCTCHRCPVCGCEIEPFEYEDFPSNQAVTTI